MTAFLRLNGIEMPVAVGSAVLDGEDIGTEHRAEDGSPVFNRRATKRKWTGKTPPLPANTALCFRDLVLGKGHVINFDRQNHYSSKGLAPSSTSGVTFTTSSPKYGAACAEWTSGLLIYPFFTATSPWTVSWWLDAGSGWINYLLRSDGAAWLDGVDGFLEGDCNGIGHPGGGTFPFGGVTPMKLDDVVALPYAVPNDWPAQMHDFGSAFGALPRLIADGLFIEQNAAIAVKGKAGPLRLSVVQEGGVISANHHEFDFELMEA